MPGNGLGLKLCTAVILAAIACIACNDDDLQPRPPKTYTVVLKPLAFTSQTALPERQVELRVVALRTAGADIETASDLAPVPGETIQWQITGLGQGGPALDQGSTRTNDDGTAAVMLDTGPIGGRTIQVQATLGDVAPVSFTVDVLQPTFALEVLSANPVPAAIDREERIRVRLVRLFGSGAQRVPVANRVLTAQLVDGPFATGARLLDGDGAATDLTTDDAGIASVTFATGSATQSGYRIRFCGNASCPGVPPAEVTINVTPRGGGGANCDDVADCDSGLACIDGSCRVPQPYCSGDRDCAPGYLCDLNLCVLAPEGPGCNGDEECGPGEVCGSANRCIPATGCLDDSDCPGGTCDEATGACIPNAPTGSALDVRGRWATAYHFDISDTLPSLVTDGLTPVVDFLSLVFWSQLDIDIPIVGDIIEGVLDSLIDDYVPGYVPVVVDALRDLLYVFQNLEVRGEMDLVQSPEAPLLGPTINGTERWTLAVITVPSLCPGGPEQFEANPTCAQVNVALESVVQVSYSNDNPIVGTRVEPFSGEVRGDRLFLYGRDVEIAARQLVNVILDVIASVASGGTFYDIEQLIVDSVPCGDLQLALDDLACDVTGGSVCQLPGVEAACTVASSLASGALNAELAQIPVGFDLEFDAMARIGDVPAGGTSELLGNPNDPAELDASFLYGGTDVLFLGGELDESSYWWAVRPGARSTR